MGDNSDNRVAESVQRSTDLRTSTVPVSVDDIDAAGLQHVTRFLGHEVRRTNLREAHCYTCNATLTAAPPVNHPGRLQPAAQPATPPPLSDDDTVVVDEPPRPYNHVVEIVRLDNELARERELTTKLKAENDRLRIQLSTVLRRAIDDNNATPLRTWIRSFFGAAIVLVFFVGACGDDTKRITADATVDVAKPDTGPAQCDAAVCSSRQDAAP